MRVTDQFGGRKKGKGPKVEEETGGADPFPRKIWGKGKGTEFIRGRKHPDHGQ